MCHWEYNLNCKSHRSLFSYWVKVSRRERNEQSSAWLKLHFATYKERKRKNSQWWKRRVPIKAVPFLFSAAYRCIDYCIIMTADYGDELVLSSPWLIHSELDMDPMHQLTEQTAGLQLNAPNASALGRDPYRWPAFEKDIGDILNQAAHRVCAETFRNISVYHPTQDHQPSSDGAKIRPDYVIAWSADGVRKNTTVADAKDYHGLVPRREYEKIRRDMGLTKVRCLFIFARLVIIRCTYWNFF